MNVFIYENKKNLLSLILWTFFTVGIYLLMMLFVFPEFMSGRDIFDKMLESMPKTFSLMFGLQAEKLFSYNGFYGFIFGYIMIMAGIMAVTQAINTFYREKKTKCVDFLMTKPVSRGKVFLAKLFVCFINVIIMNIVFIVSAVIIYEKHIDRTFFVELISLFLGQIIFMVIGIVIAVFAKKVRSSAGIATITVFGLFIISMLDKIIDSKIISYLSPFSYFSPIQYVTFGSFETGKIIMAVFILLAGLLGSFFYYVKSDCHAV